MKSRSQLMPTSGWQEETPLSGNQLREGSHSFSTSHNRQANSIKKKAVGSRLRNPANRRALSAAMLGLMFSASSLPSGRQAQPMGRAIYARRQQASTNDGQVLQETIPQEAGQTEQASEPECRNRPSHVNGRSCEEGDACLVLCPKFLLQEIPGLGRPDFTFRRLFETLQQGLSLPPSATP